ncbi:hypothetical protein DBV14_19330 [Variovorax sp. KBW07]|uniref:DUF4123 domain-containing protein n=1 Tax=Variovorax sp. KBW07 TaxID=2153358 RepID=UPI000F55E240|nr:DUF4123 domain-containing protein [Variovorax sp. KBW07]RQO48813.1 hypothetical protein DBV14_19330 [Variovorax sp. KBW07]
MYFAQDPTNLEAAKKFLTDAFATEPELHWIVLVDGAFDHGNGAAGTVYEGLNCYAAEYPLNDLAGAAPWLVELDALAQSHEQIEKLLAHCSGRPMLSFLASRIPVRALAKRWLPLHRVHTSDKQRLLLRFADTRTLPLLPDILLPAQWADIAAPLVHWFFVAREGAMVPLPLPDAEGDSPSALRLSQVQLDAMVKACEPDAALDMLAEQMPEIFAPNVAHGKLHGYIKRKTFGLIDRYGIENWTDKVSLVTAELLTNGKMHEDPKLQELLLTKAWQPGNLREALLDHKLV